MIQNEFLCPTCGLKEEQLLRRDEKAICPKCDTEMQKIPQFGGYKIKGNNSASTRPKHAGSFKRGK